MRLRHLMTRAREQLPFLLLALPALGVAVALTHDLTWPYDVDFLREIAQAQVLSDGAWSSEPFYLGEKLWYPPLGPALVAALARLTGLPVPLVYARAGAYVNFLAPVFLYLLAGRLFGRVAGLAAAFDYIYLRPAWVPGWAAGTYSPWLLSGILAQVPFLGGLWAYEASASRPATWRDLRVGLFLALAVLAHASAGLLLIVVLGGAALAEWKAAGSWRALALRRHAVIAASGLVLAAPYAVLLLGHYARGVANTVPAGWIWSGLSDWSELKAQVTWSLLLVPVGLVPLLVRPRSPLGARLALLWVVGSLCLLLVNFRLPLVPAHHLLAYLRAGLSLVIGAGVAWLVDVARSRRTGRDLAWRWGDVVATCVALACVLPSYPQRRDLGQGRLLSKRWMERPNQIPVYEWLRAHGDAEDVVLASDELGMNVVGPSGRKVVAVPSLWASPFVDNERRRTDRDRMLAALAQGDPAAFCALAHFYRVRYLLHTPREEPASENVLLLLRHVFDSGKIGIDEVRGCAGRPVS